MMGERMTLLKRARNLLRDFTLSRRGNVAVMFGLALVPMMIAAGVGLDFARAAMTRAQMGEALDAASLAVGSTTGLDQAKALALAQKYFAANYHGEGTPNVTITNFDAKGSVTVSASTSVSRTLLRIIGDADVQVSAASTAVWGQSKLWVSLVLDNSTSMMEGSPTTKMAALQAASKKLLDKLKGAAATPGDVKVAIVPFTHLVNVGTANVGANWLYWGDWEAQPANALLDGVTDNTGPGSSCPFTSTSHGFRCQQTPTNGSSSTNNIPSSGTYKGYICPGLDSGAKNTAHYDRYYNGCWTSTPTQTKTETRTDITPVINKKQTCSQTGTGPVTCTDQGGTYPQNGTTSSSTTTAITAGYTGDSTTTDPATLGSETYSDGRTNCRNGTCTWTRTYYQNKTQVTTTKTGAAPWTHAWVVNSHSTWSGCLMDREQDYDVQSTAPDGSNTTGFPAANNQNCFNARISPLNYNWTDLAAQITAMVPDGSTNQPIGVAHGMQMLVPGAPYDTPAVPANTSRYIILFSDGLNTQDRWYDDLSLMSTGSTRINDRMTLVCNAAKAEGIVVYSVYVHIGGLADSSSMQNCASDAGKYYNLTSTDQIDTAFQDIAQKITNVRVAQ